MSVRIDFCCDVRIHKGIAEIPRNAVDEESIPSLDELAIKYGTDKSSLGHGYTETYEKIFSQFRNDRFSMLEIGVDKGCSMRMWREYFPDASIYGIDQVLTPEAEDCCDRIFIGDQLDRAFLQSVIAEIGQPHLIIDDGGHKAAQQITSFQVLFPQMQSGGIYVVEDTHTWYKRAYFSGGQDGESYFKQLIRDVNVAGRGLTGSYEKAINWNKPDPPVPALSHCLKSMLFVQSLLICVRR